MKKVQKFTREVEEVVDVVCNKCGGTCCVYDDPSNGFYGLIEAVVHGGYYSEHLRDMQTYTFSLCEKCLSELFSTFKVSPIEEEYNLG